MASANNTRKRQKTDWTKWGVLIAAISGVAVPWLLSLYADLDVRRQDIATRYIGFTKEREVAVRRLSCYLSHVPPNAKLDNAIREDIRDKKLNDEQFKKMKAGIQRIKSAGLFTLARADDQLIDFVIDLHVSYHEYLMAMRTVMDIKTIERANLACFGVS